MATTLATQLAELAAHNPNAGRLHSAKSLKSRESYLFTPRQAAVQSLDDVHALGIEGLEGLLQLNPGFEQYRASLFGEGARRLDRTLLAKEEVGRLDETLGRFLMDVGPHILVKPSANALEWLIRRFRINEFNVGGVVASFLPYYATPQFAAMLHIVHLERHPELSWLLPVQATRDPLPQQHLFDSLLKSTEALRFVADVLPSVLRANADRAHRALVGFHLSTLLGVFEAFATRRRKPHESAFSPAVVSIILPSLRIGLKATSNPEVQLASYVLTSAFAQRARPSADIVAALVKVVAHSRPKAPQQGSRILDGGWTDCDEALVRTLVALYQVTEGDVPMSTKSADRLVGIVGLEAMIAKISSRFDATAFWTALTRAVIDGAHQGSDHQTALLLRFARDAQLAVPMATSLLDSLVIALASLDEPDPTLTRALGILSQRHPDAFERSARLQLSSRPDRKNVIEGFIKLVALGEGSENATQTDALALHSASDVARESALAKILGGAKDATTAEETQTVHAAALRALADPKPTVAQLLTLHADTIVATLQPSELLEASLSTLGSEDLPRASLKEHLGLLCGIFLARHPTFAARVATEVIEPRLLVTKSGAKAASIAWSVVAATKAATWKGTSLQGIEKLKVPEASAEAAALSNRAYLELLARNLTKSTGAPTAPPTKAPAASKLLCLMTLWAASAKLPQPRLLVAIRQILAFVDIDSTPAMLVRDLDFDETLSVAYSKTSSPKTLARAAAGALLASVQRLISPPEAVFSWLDARPPGDVTAFRQTVGDVFRLVGTGQEGTLGHALGVKVRDVVEEDALAFLASLWTGPFDEHVRSAALDQATTVARSTSKDLQLVLPHVFVALADPSRAVRQAAVMLVEAMGSSDSTEIYGYQRFYGATSSDRLLYLEPTESARVVKILAAAQSELLLNADVIETVLEDHLAAHDAEAARKPGAGLKHSLLCFVLSHVAASQDMELRCKLLRSVRRLQDPLRAKATAGLIEELVEGRGVVAEAEKSSAEQYADLVMVCFASPPKGFGKAKDPAFQLLMKAIEAPAATPAGAALRAAALARIKQGLTKHLPIEQRVHLCHRLVQLGASDEPGTASDVAAVRAIVDDASVFVALVRQINTTVAAVTTRSQKKARTSTGAVSKDGLPSSSLIELSLLLENVSLSAMEATPDVISTLIDTLRMLNQASAQAHADVQFSAQLVVAALVELAPKAVAHVHFDATSLQLGPVLDYMKACPSPYLAQQAVLFIAEIAPAAPDQVLQSVMPVFTFVGASVLQRDDAASARTVQKVIDALVPPFLAAAKRDGSDRVSVVQGMRELLLAFVEASGHIPRHRRLRLFVHLVQALGPYHFLGATVMLLLTQGSADCAELALSLWDAFPPELGISALAHVLVEILVKSPAESVLPPATSTPAGDTVMEDVDADESETSRRPQLLLNFIRAALGSRSLASKLDADRSALKADSDAVLSHFIEMTGEIAEHQPEVELASLTQAAARDIAYLAADLIDLDALSQAVVRLLQSGAHDRAMHGLDILRVRLPSVKPSRRTHLETAVRAAIQVCDEQLTISLTADPSASAADTLLSLATLDAIAASPAQSELNTLASALPTVIQTAQSPSLKISIAALEVAGSIGRHLGPRFIPQIGPTVQTAASLLRKGVAAATTDLVRASFDLLTAIVRSSGAFLGPQLSQLVALVADTSSVGKGGSGAESRASFVSALVKAVKLADVLPVIQKAWQDAAAKEALLDLLRRFVKGAKPADVAASAKAVFAFLLQVLDLRCSGAAVDAAAGIESGALDVYMVLVLKLTEPTFKPLLLRTVDWAVLDTGKAGSSSTARTVVLFKLFRRLLASLKSIGVPFVVHILDHAAASLEAFAASRDVDLELWDEIVAVLQKALENDTVGFWTSERLVKIVDPVANQVSLTPKLPANRPVTHLVPLIGKLSGAVTPHDTLLKVLNAGLLRGVRSADVRVKRVSLEALDAAWRQLGPALVPFIPEIVGGGVAEALEEPEGGVEKAARALLKRIEGELGGESIESYLA